MRISVIGLGYVGLVSAVCFTKLKHKVIGVDINKQRIEDIKAGRNPLKAVRGLGDYIKKYPFETILNGHGYAILNSDISFVCVETPCKKNGDINLNPLKKVCKQIGEVLKEKKYHLFVVRSTIFPGSLKILKEVLEKSSNKKCGKDFDMALNPEFLREKTALKDFFNPSFIVIGTEKQKVGKKVLKCYDGIDGEKQFSEPNTKKFIVKLEVAQMIKYINNSWHACKVSFTNEVGRICEKAGINGNKLMGLFCEDKKLNINKYYHKIGGAFDGHCLPKDLLVLQIRARKLKVKCPLLNSISKSNEIQKKQK